jgi:hypothetical protein
MVGINITNPQEASEETADLWIPINPPIRSSENGSCIAYYGPCIAINKGYII